MQSKIAAAVFAAKAQNSKFESLLSNYDLLSFGLRGMFFFIVMALNLEHAPIGAVHRISSSWVPISAIRPSAMKRIRSQKRVEEAGEK